MFFGNIWKRCIQKRSVIRMLEEPIAAGGIVNRPMAHPILAPPAFLRRSATLQSKSMIRHFVPIFKRSGVKAVFSRHEHNFQHSRVDGINYFITGAGGKVRLEPPSNFADAHTIGWAASGNFLIVEVTTNQMVVTPMAALGATGELAELVIFDPLGIWASAPIVIDRE